MLNNIIALALITFVTSFIKNLAYRIVRLCMGDEKPRKEYNNNYRYHYAEEV